MAEHSTSFTSVLASLSPLLLFAGVGYHFFFKSRPSVSASSLSPAPSNISSSPDEIAHDAIEESPIPRSAAEQKARLKALRKAKLKMVLVVRNDISMTKGKMAAQCCHAAVGVVLDLIDNDERDIVDAWNDNGALKVTLKVNSEEEVHALAEQCEQNNLPHYVVVDAGHTQLPPNTTTVLSIGPAPGLEIDKLTGHLKLM